MVPHQRDIDFPSASRSCQIGCQLGSFERRQLILQIYVYMMFSTEDSANPLRCPGKKLMFSLCLCIDFMQDSREVFVCTARGQGPSGQPSALETEYPTRSKQKRTRVRIILALFKVFIDFPNGTLLHLENL